MGAAYACHESGHKVTVYEKNDRIGGHSRTIDINIDDRVQTVDTGFIVFNYRNYPHLTAMFDHLGVDVEKSDMSFGADIGVNGKAGWLQYSSKNMIRPQNLLRLQYWKMLFDIMKFNRKATSYLDRPSDITIADAVEELKLGRWFQDYYLQAMGAAIWSSSINTIKDFPAKTFVSFFKNHGLLTINDHPQWYTVTGGSRAYIKKLTAKFKDDIKLSCGAVKVERKHDKVFVHDEAGDVTEFDHVIFACHADQAMMMLNNPTDQEKEIIGAFEYQDNHVVVHQDESFMPHDKSCWASWIYLSENQTDNSNNVSLSYWMNNLQNFVSERAVIVTLNPERQPDKDTVLDEYKFEHPVFNRAAIDAQEKLDMVQGSQNCWYAGAYQRYGFHEDGLLSAVNVLKKMDVKIPWM